MKLSFHKGYEDYTDLARWEPRYEELIALFESLHLQQWAQFDDDRLLNTMEDLEELMRYYCVTRNFAGLEPVMRKFYDMLQLCKRRMIKGVGTLYLEMVFLRIDGLLYRANGLNRQSVQGYDKCLEVARKCFAALKISNLEDYQCIYVGWNCAECWKEASEVHDLVMDVPGSVAIQREVLPVLKWLEPYLMESPGICDQVSEMYANAGGTFYQNGDAPAGGACYRSCCELLRNLDVVYDSDFYMARAIWMRGIHGLMELTVEGSAKIMLQCEAEAEEYLRRRPGAELRDRTIVEAAKAVVDIQRGMALQQNGKLEEAAEILQNSIAELDVSVECLRKEIAGRNDYYGTILEKIAGRIYNTYVGSKETLGVLYYQNNDPVAAELEFKEVLKELVENESMKAGGSNVALIKAETLQYLGIISADEGDGYQADFYGTQAADLALTLGEETGSPLAWGVAVISCSLVAEISLIMKNKPKAGTYADKGLAACDVLERLVPDSPQLTMRSELSKNKRKASRKFFW